LRHSSSTQSFTSSLIVIVSLWRQSASPGALGQARSVFPQACTRFLHTAGAIMTARISTVPITNARLRGRVKNREEKTMNLQTRKLLTGALLGLVAVSTPALSQNTGLYAGFTLGQSKAKDACAGVVGPGTSCDEKDAAYKILGGYQVNRNFGVEFAYVHLGEVKASFAGFGNVVTTAEGFELLGVGTIPINQQWSVYGKLGSFRWDVHQTGIVEPADATGTDLTYGFGVKYNVTKSAALRVEYQQYNDVGDFNTTGKTDVSVIGVGVIARF